MKNLIFVFALVFATSITGFAQNNTGNIQPTTQTNNAQVETLFKQGLEYFQQEDYKKAIKLWEQAAKIDSTKPNLFYNLGSAYYNSEQYSKAAVAFQKVLELDPNHSKAKNDLADAQAAETKKKEKRRALWSGIVGAVNNAVAAVKSDDDEDKSQSNQTENGGTKNAAPADLGATKLQGNYTFSNGYNVFKRFVFSSDGTFKRGGAASGTTTNGSYVGASTDTGKYSVNGETLILYTDDGKTETHSLSIRGEGLSPLYLVIDGQTFTNRD